MTGEKNRPNEEDVSLRNLFEVYDQLTPWDQYKLHVFLNAKLPQNELQDIPLDWLVFRSQIGIEIHSRMEDE
jgi:hypothetical protein